MVLKKKLTVKSPPGLYPCPLSRLNPPPSSSVRWKRGTGGGGGDRGAWLPSFSFPHRSRADKHRLAARCQTSADCGQAVSGGPEEVTKG